MIGTDQMSTRLKTRKMTGTGMRMVIGIEAATERTFIPEPTRLRELTEGALLGRYCGWLRKLGVLYKKTKI